jgi:uncharacterized protein (TIGR00251 family)
MHEMANDLGWLRVRPGEITIEILARPGSSRSGIIGAGPRGLIVAVHAPPAEGRANAEMVAILAKALDIPRSAIELIAGAGSRVKIVRIVSSNPAILAEKVRLAVKTTQISYRP